MSKTILIFALTVVMAVITGCRSGAVFNVDDATVVASTDKVSASDVQKAIIRAGASLGWVMKNSGAGKIVGTLRIRKHVAIIDIDYSAKSYSIHYKDSENLNYDGNTIHNNYNGWIQRLNSGIQSQLSLL